MDDTQAITRTGLLPRIGAAIGNWWHGNVTDTVEQAEIISRRREESELDNRYLLMLAMSGGIAILGLLLSSPAVVIGAMLLSPLMGPIMGLGFALAIGDYGWMRQGAITLVAGSALAVALCALIVLLSPLQTVTSEIAARTRPNLFDLLVALFSAIAGAYATIRGREGMIVGVAIATALMPPLAVVGFGLATFNWTVFSGALLLFFTNFMVIALTAAVVARFYGFRSSLSPKQTRIQTVLLVAMFLALALPLGYALRNIAWESSTSRQVNSALQETFGSRSRISQVDVDYGAEPIRVTATVLTPRLRPDAEAKVANALSERIGYPAHVVITQFLVGTSATAAEQAEIAAALAREDAGAAQAERVASRLTLAAGVGPEDVIIDRDRRRAFVNARALPGATLATYRELERRIAASEPGWDIRLRPPLLPLPSIEFEDGAITEEGAMALSLGAWAAQRLDLPVVASGSDANTGIVVELLDDVRVEARPETGSGQAVNLDWDQPEA